MIKLHKLVTIGIKLSYLGLIWSVRSAFWAGLTFVLATGRLPTPTEIWAFCLYTYPLFLSSFIAAIAVLLAFAVIFTKNPIYSLLCLIGTLFVFIFWFLLQNIEFLSFIFLIVYIGAISILFLFVIMMFNLQDLTFFGDGEEDITWLHGISLCVFAKYLEIFIDNILNQDYLKHLLAFDSILYETASIKSDILLFNESFYTTDISLFLISGCLLLTSMLGAIILALSTLD